MATVAAEQDTVSALASRPVDDRSVAQPRALPEAEWSRLERLFLRYATWGSEHPHNALSRAQHKLATTLMRLGYGRFDNDMVLTTIGRTSGQPRHVIVGAMFIHDRLYVINPFGDRAHWYRNLLLDPIVTLQRRGKTWTARATRVTAHDEAVAFYEQTGGATGYMLRLYLRAEGIAETAEDFADHVDRFCFVRFDAVVEPGPPPLRTDLVWVWPVAGLMGATTWLARRRLRPALATVALAVPALVASSAAWGGFEARYSDSGMRLEGRWAYLWNRVWPRLMWWVYDGFADALELRSDDDVLDVACGCGTFLRTRCDGAHLIAGVDHSETFIDIARQESQARVEDGTADFRVGDVADLPWADDTFSVVTSNDIGCYEDRAKPAIEEMYRVLRRGGRAVLADDRHELMEAAGFTEVTVEPHRFGSITKGIKR